MEQKIQREIEAFRGELSILEELSRGTKVKMRKEIKLKRKYNLPSENDIPTAKKRIKQKIQERA